MADIRGLARIQQLEGNVIMPMVSRHAVALPLALSLFAVVALGVHFGPMASCWAPLAIVLFVLVREVKPMPGSEPPVAPP